MVVAVVLQMKLMAVMVAAELLAAGMTAMPSAGGRVTRGRERGGQRNRGNDGSEE